MYINHTPSNSYKHIGLVKGFSQELFNSLLGVLPRISDDLFTKTEKIKYVNY